MRPTQLLAAVMAVATVSTAMPDVFDKMPALSGAKNFLMGRQDDNSKASSQPTRSTSQPTSTSSNDDSDKSSTRRATGSAQVTSSSKATRITTGAATNSTAFDARLPAGGISMITPGALAGEQYYKVGDWVTFAWNYTSLSVTPSALDILATCTANQATYTIGVNVSAAQTQILWNTKDTPSGQAPFLTEKYTLLIYDAESSVTAAPRPGYLAVFNSLSFGMYTPQPKVDWADFQCANCVKNGALSHSEKMTIRLFLLTSGTTIASLLYFTHNFGMW